MYDSDYPYEERDDQGFRFNSFKPVIKPIGFEYCTYQSSDIRKHCDFTKIDDMLQRGPLSVGIDGSAIQNYKNGIFYSNTCIYDIHAVILVGFNYVD